MPTENLTTSKTLTGKYSGIPLSKSPKEAIPSVFVTMVAPKEKWMDALFPDGTIKKIPKTIEVPYGSHINSGETIRMAREKGYYPLDEATEEVRALYEEAAARDRDVTQSGWEEKIEGLKAKEGAEIIEAREGTCAGMKKDGTPCGIVTKRGEKFCRWHQ